MANRRKIPLEIIERIKFLRSRGYSLPEISHELSISKTSVLRYIKDVQILPEYISEWAGKRGGSKKIRLNKEREALEESRKLIQDLSYKEKMLFLCALYWAEGNKKDFILTNTDPDLIKVFVSGLREVFGVSDDRFSISIRIYEDIDKDKSLSFWSELVKIPKEKFLSVHVMPGKKHGKLQYGMCRVRITKGGDLLKKVFGINKITTELFVPVAQRTE